MRGSRSRTSAGAETSSQQWYVGKKESSVGGYFVGGRGDERQQPVINQTRDDTTHHLIPSFNHSQRVPHTCPAALALRFRCPIQKSDSRFAHRGMHLVVQHQPVRIPFHRPDPLPSPQSSPSSLTCPYPIPWCSCVHPLAQCDCVVATSTEPPSHTDRPNLIPSHQQASPCSSH